MIFPLILFLQLQYVRTHVYEIQTWPIDLEDTITIQIVFTLELGEPKQAFEVHLNPAFDDLVVFDSNCGEPLVNKCPKYCGETKYQLYCTDFLCGLSKQAKQFICNVFYDNSHLYNSTQSATFQNIDGQFWKRRLPDSRTLIGLYAKERMSITADNDNTLIVDNFTFVRGISLDSRLFIFGGNAIFGIAPGENSIINRLYRQKLIDAPLLSINVKDNRMTIGARDTKSCSLDWHYFSTTSKTGWEFDADVYFSPMGWFNKTKVVSKPTTFPIQIHPSALEFLKLKWEYLFGYPFGVIFDQCQQNLTIEYHIGGRKFALYLNDIGFSYSDDQNSPETCELNIEKEPNTAPYTGDFAWTLTIPFFNRYCHLFDFERNTMGLSEVLE